MWTLLAAVIAAIAGVVTTAIASNANSNAIADANAANAAATKATNEANLQAVRETNASNVEQANIAYQRSLPVNQVHDLMQAGMSRAGALNKLSGGGVYSPPALSTATMQSSTQQPKHFDYSGIAQAMDKLNDLPANVQQKKIVDQQLADMKQEAEIRQQRELRERQKHEFDMWSLRYGKKTAELLDGVSSKVVEAASAKDYDLSQAKTVQQIMRDLGLDKDKDYQNMPHLARLQLFDAIKSANDQRMSQERHEASQVASFDTHKLAELDHALKSSQLDEQNRTLVYKLGILANQLEESNLSLDKSNYEKVIRDAGFENRKEAEAALSAAENLRAMYERDKARRLANSPGALAVIDLTLEKLNPLRELIKIGK